jgi:class I fructose-bisphosphate aldolase
MVIVSDLRAEPEVNVQLRPTLEVIAHNAGMGRARFSELYRMFYCSGPGNGTMLSLPFDQLVEHGIGHVFNWARSADPRAVIELANTGYFSALALSIGQAEKYQHLICPDVPLLVKVDGHLLVGKEVQYDRHSNMASVERAVAAGANAVGFTFYIGGKETERDMERVAQIVESAHDLHKPVFMWAYTRGPLPDAMGADSLYWCAQGVSVAESLGVDVVKQKFPMPAKNNEVYRKNLSRIRDEKGYFYSSMPNVSELLKLEPEDPKNVPYDMHVKRLAFMSLVAPNLLKIISGGPKSENEDELLNVLRAVMDSGNEGQIVGRNLWGRPIDEAKGLAKRMHEIMREEKYHRALKEQRFQQKVAG